VFNHNISDNENSANPPKKNPYLLTSPGIDCEKLTFNKFQPALTPYFVDLKPWPKEKKIDKIKTVVSSVFFIIAN
jgi:hypothetical protein